MKRTLIAAVSMSAALAWAAPDADQLVGTWNCGLSNDMPNGSMNLDGTVSYNADRSADYDMVMAMDISMQDSSESIKLGMNGSGTWRVEGDKLVTTTESMDLTNLGEPSQFVDMIMPQFKAQQQQLIGQENRSTIVELTDTKLVERPAGGEQTTTCTR